MFVDRSSKCYRERENERERVKCCFTSQSRSHIETCQFWDSVGNQGAWRKPLTDGKQIDKLSPIRNCLSEI